MIRLQDQMGRELGLNQPARRIISLVPSITELLADLGLSEEIVGLTSWCVHPAGLREQKMVIGGTKNLDKDKIDSLKPDLIIGNKEENPKEQIEALGDEIPIYISDIESLEQAYRMIEDVGILCAKEKESKLMLEKFRSAEAALIYQENLSFLYFIWKDPWMVAGEQTYISKVLSLIGMKNLAPQDRGRYPELSLEEIRALNPERIILSSEPYDFKSKDLKTFHELGFRSQLVNGELFTWYGSRIGKTLDYLRKRPFRLK